MPITIKLHYNDDIFRFSLEEATPYSGVVSYLKRFYLQEVEHFALRYRDDEDDEVLLTSQSDWEEALRIVGPKKILHMYVSTTTTGKGRSIPIRTGSATASATANNDNNVEEEAERNPVEHAFAQFAKHGLKMPEGVGTPGFDMSQLLSLAQTPAAAQMMQALGIDPSQAGQLLSRLSQKNEEKANGEEEDEDEDEEIEEVVALCDECDLPIEVDDVRWMCTVCRNFDLHEKCRAASEHDEGHAWTTNYASEEHIAALQEMGSAGRDYVVELLNMHRGNFEEALQTLLQVN